MATKASNGVIQSNNLVKDNGNYGAKTNAVHNQQYHQQRLPLTGPNYIAREMEDPATKAYVKEMAARALWLLAKGNSYICRSITKSRALLCFAVLLEKGPEKIQYNFAMALMEIAAVAEEDAELRRSAFKPNSPARKAVVDQLFTVIEKTDSELLISCIKLVYFGEQIVQNRALILLCCIALHVPDSE